MTALEKIRNARTRLLLDSPWYGSLAMRLTLIADETTPTFATDGTRLVYNPKFALSLSDSELIAVIAHEVLHCALLHPYRRGQRDHETWNQACDYAINYELSQAGFTLPSDCLLDPQYAGLSSDVIYARLGDKPKDEGQDAANSSTGTVQDAPKQGQGQDSRDDQPGSEPSDAMTQDDWKIATEQATAVSNACGKTPGGSARAAKLARQSQEDWRTVLKEFVTNQVPSDFTWSTPNRRHIADGLYLPGILKENIGHIAIAIDTSGSIDQAMLNAFATELTSIVQEVRPELIDVIYCDASIQHTETFTADDNVVLTMHGGGGTKFSPVFDHLNSQDETPLCCIYFTDLDCYESLTEPSYPVLWVTDKRVTRQGKFGRTLHVDMFE